MLFWESRWREWGAFLLVLPRGNHMRRVRCFCFWCCSFCACFCGACPLWFSFAFIQLLMIPHGSEPIDTYPDVLKSSEARPHSLLPQFQKQRSFLIPVKWFPTITSSHYSQNHEEMERDGKCWRAWGTLTMCGQDSTKSFLRMNRANSSRVEPALVAIYRKHRSAINLLHSTFVETEGQESKDRQTEPTPVGR